MSDYERVTRVSPEYEGDRYEPSEAGEFKVVPADDVVVEIGDMAIVDAVPGASDGSLIAVITVNDQQTEHLYWTPGQRDPWLMARLYLSIAEYLDTHQRVDEARVAQMLADISVAYSSESGTPRAKVLARRLVEQGWTKP